MPYVRSKTYKRRTPAAKTRKTTYRKKRTTYKKRSSGPVIASSRPTIQRGYLPLGHTYWAKLPYVDNFAISADGTTGLSSTDLTYAANDPWDPQFSAGGHQPMQWDVMAAHYERVWCWGCHVTMTFSNPSADGMYVGYRCRNATDGVSTVNQTLSHIQEIRNCALRPINNTGSQVTTFKFYVSNPKLFGILKSQYSNITYSSTTNNHPGAFNLIEPFAIHTVAGQTGVIRCNIKLIYHCQFTNPISEAQN